MPPLQIQNFQEVRNEVRNDHFAAHFAAHFTPHFALWNWRNLLCANQRNLYKGGVQIIGPPRFLAPASASRTAKGSRRADITLRCEDKKCKMNFWRNNLLGFGRSQNNSGAMGSVSLLLLWGNSVIVWIFNKKKRKKELAATGIRTAERLLRLCKCRKC